MSSNVIDFEKKRQEKVKENDNRKKELEKRRGFELNMGESNILIHSYINYINADLELFQELITEDDKEIARNEIKTVFSLLRMLFKKYKKLDYYDNIRMSWNYKNLYYTIMVAYANLDADEEYEFMEKEEKIELNLYYRLVELDHKIAELIHGPSVEDSKMPSWMKEQEIMAEEDYQEFKFFFNQEFLNKVVLMEDPINESYLVARYPEAFKGVLKKLKKKEMVEYIGSECPGGWRIKGDWEEVLQEFSGFNLDVVPLSEQEKEEVSHIYSIELLEEQIANIISRMGNMGLKVSDSFLDE